MKILVVRFSSAGDILCTTPVLRLLRRRWPNAHITYLTRTPFSGLLESNEHITELLLHPVETTLSDELRLRRKLRGKNFDLVVDLHASTRSRLVTAGISARLIRHRKDLFRRLRVRAGRTRSDLPVPLRHIQMLHSLGIEDDGGGLEFPVGPIGSPLPSGLTRPVVAIAPGARHATKRWPSERFAETATRLLQTTGLSIVLVGGPDDRIWGEKSVVDIPDEDRSRVIDMIGKTGWQETGRVVAEADLLISNDSVAGHIAAAVGTPVVSLFGSTVPEFGYVPFRVPVEIVEIDDLDCRPCTRTGREDCPLGHFRCMNDISVDLVLDAVRRLLLKQTDDSGPPL